jgi:hypothetical protein
MSPPKHTAVPRALAVAAAVLAPVAVAIVYRFPPTENSLYPRCYFHSLTGLHCPGCGATRAVHALIHGDLAQAAAYNLLFVCFLPALVAWAACQWWSLLTGRPLPSWRLPPWTTRALFVVVLVYWVVRNLPFAPFTYLAPHQLSPG